MLRPGASTTTAGPGCPVDPIAPDLHRILRRAVLDHVTSERRRVHPPVVHAGLPGAEVVLPLDRRPLDQALRVDVLEAMLRRAAQPAPLVWLTRSGTLEVQDLDLAWSSAARAAGAELDREVMMVVVTRQGWRDPGNGNSRTWRRLRAPRA